ncbi:MAG: excinuclease ATPase subunit [Pseudomonadota bacterium]
MTAFTLWKGVRISVILGGLVAILPGTASKPALAADDLVLVNVAEAMSTADYREKLDGSVKFYFGASPHPAVVENFGNVVTNKKTNGFAKSGGEACRWVLLSALIALQDDARSRGANAVVNIKSYFKRNEVSNDTQAECYKGFFIASVALKGDIVKLAN